MKGSTVILSPQDVLHIPGLGFDGLVGYSPIAMAKNAIGLAMATEEYGAKFFANGAAPSGVLEHPGVIKNPELAPLYVTVIGIFNSVFLAVINVAKSAKVQLVSLITLYKSSNVTSTSS